MTLRKIAAAMAAAAVISISGTAAAAGFQLNEQSVAGMGRAFGGQGIMGDDASAAWYNPAGMTLLPGTQLQVNAVANSMDMSYEGGDGSSENGRKRISPILSEFITHQFSDTIWGGLAITMPFGLSDSFATNWSGADRGYDAKLLAININPSVAWKVNDKLSLGFGLSAQYVDATVSLRKDVSTGGLSIPLYSRVEADDWGYGWNIGAMWTPTSTLRLGFGYRSKITHKADGEVKFSTDDTTKATLSALSSYYGTAALSAMVSGLGLSATDLMGLMSSGFSLSGGAELDAPACAHLSIVWEYSPSLRFSGSLRWTDWSSLDKIIINAGSLPHSSTDVEMGWRDTWFVSAGVDYDINSKWTIRGGLAVDSSPIVDAKNRTALVPDANRLWFTLGATYRFDEHWQFDIAGTHLHGFGERSLYNKGGEKIGKFEDLNCYMVGIGVVYRF